MTIRFRSAAAVGVVLAVAGCDYSGDFLFPGVDDVDDIWVMTDADGEFLVPVDLEAACQDLGLGSCAEASAEEKRQVISAATVYAEVGPATTTAYGGVTVDFVGTGSEVCIWVDPELVYWNQAVADRPAENAQKWTYPDNVFDDGDMDLFGGLSVYYTGSPGETIGDFKVAYEDSLGNDVPISLALCPNELGSLNEVLVSGGRGAPDYCTMPPTDIGIGYTALLRTWSTPLDDDRMAFGFILASGDCDALRSLGGSSNQTADECVIQGEALSPSGGDFGPFYGFDEVNDAGRVWTGSVEVEVEYCDPEGRLDRFCNREVDAHDASGTECWRPAGPADPTDSPTADSRCYCGDPDDTPQGGAL